MFLFVTGLHSVYALFGLTLAAWLLLSPTARPGSAASLAAAGLYWLVISAIGLLLIPAFYV